MKTNTERLKLRYEFIVADYVEAFTKKHNWDFNGWIGNDIGGVAEFADYFFNFDVIRYDIDNNIRKSTILKWYDADLEHNQDRSEPQHINYSSYCKGLRHKDLNKKRRMTKEQKEELDKLQEKIEELRQEIIKQYPLKPSDCLIDDYPPVPDLKEMKNCKD